MEYNVPFWHLKRAHKKHLTNVVWQQSTHSLIDLCIWRMGDDSLLSEANCEHLRPGHDIQMRFLLSAVVNFWKENKHQSVSGLTISVEDGFILRTVSVRLADHVHHIWILMMASTVMTERNKMRGKQWFLQKFHLRNNFCRSEVKTESTHWLDLSADSCPVNSISHLITFTLCLVRRDDYVGRYERGVGFLQDNSNFVTVPVSIWLLFPVPTHFTQNNHTPVFFFFCASVKLGAGRQISTTHIQKHTHTHTIPFICLSVGKVGSLAFTTGEWFAVFTQEMLVTIHTNLRRDDVIRDIPQSVSYVRYRVESWDNFPEVNALQLRQRCTGHLVKVLITFLVNYGVPRNKDKDQKWQKVQKLSEHVLYFTRALQKQSQGIRCLLFFRQSPGGGQPVHVDALWWESCVEVYLGFWLAKRRSHGMCQWLWLVNFLHIIMLMRYDW